eukprot:CAMPEP_0181192398 /NCGR_PEP_ID=MMETSP1096-20121128/13263_1 /TAXON_ID=156174 ORGANISM="Chrysochromulina ericina, Strain CCMP281" /NCGR_SAMPLE_ID=MMETSP1096 /ASSEMBLY_ACC=CAM_ASM_000453 /LENGTH=139 /DNA_ID=CAMNT_0023281793 /DNA_START=26 /DNA_END=445 /DNA_ORIENTATION=+
MLSVVSAFTSSSSALVVGAMPTAQVRASAPQMADISAFDEIWGMDAKLSVYNAWNPDAPRDYDNFNPFERNDEGSMADQNGCFPGQSRGYKVPNRPDVSWTIQQANDKIMADLKTQDKFNLKGKPGNFSPSWQKTLGAP